MNMDNIISMAVLGCCGSTNVSISHSSRCRIRPEQSSEDTAVFFFSAGGGLAAAFGLSGFRL